MSEPIPTHRSLLPVLQPPARCAANACRTLRRAALLAGNERIERSFGAKRGFACRTKIRGEGRTRRMEAATRGMHSPPAGLAHASPPPAAQKEPDGVSPSQETMEKANLSKLLIESHYQVSAPVQKPPFDKMYPLPLTSAHRSPHRCLCPCRNVRRVKLCGPLCSTTPHQCLPTATPTLVIHLTGRNPCSAPSRPHPSSLPPALLLSPDARPRLCGRTWPRTNATACRGAVRWTAS